jgi:methylglutaconyl-CoA hydratase
MPYQTILVRQDGPVVQLALNRPEVRNAFNAEMVAELTDWARAIRSGEQRAAVLSGAGPTFCAGADLGWMAQSLGYTQDENARDAERLAAMFEALDRVPVPLIARIQGAALGGGAGLAAVCDIAVAEAPAVFGFTEVKLGIIPAVISPYVLGKIGRAAARQLFLTGERFTAERALAIGLVQIVAAPGALDDEVQRVVSELLTAGPQAAAAAKQLIRDVAGRNPQDVMPTTAEAIAARRVSAEGQEGMRAFLEKRRPAWQDAR